MSEERIRNVQNMNLTIKPLTSELTDDYLCFFENEVSHDNPDQDWDRCYCVCFAGDDQSAMPDPALPSKRREMAKEYIKSGKLQGYLAYDNGRVVGWCNANTKINCTKCFSWLRFMNDVPVDINEKIKSIFCFAIAPDMKRKGIASALLTRVCEDAAKDGFDAVECYPNAHFANEFDDFRGPAGLFEKHGFHVHHELDGWNAVRRETENVL
jgi:GNAT superfamily N-acetyltransferase